MAVRKKGRHAHRQGRTNDAGESEHEARLAPLEEKKGVSAQPNSAQSGVLAVNTGELKLPRELSEEEEAAAQRFLPIDPYVFAVLCFTIIFILSTAYVIWSGWEPPK